MGRKPKIYQPWEDLVEHHPWKMFPNNTNISKKLIIGSFPPNRFTNHNERKTKCDMDFFYGSKDSGFWELFTETLGLNFKISDDLESLKKWLINNNWS